MSKGNFNKKLNYLCIFIFVFILGIALIYLKKVHDCNQIYYQKNKNKSQISLRKFPFPFRASMAISNDVDNTESLDEFLNIHFYLNSNKNTTMGIGIGLKIGNSFLPFEPPTGAISLFNGSVETKNKIIKLINEGSIDIIHSYGKKDNFSRLDAMLTLEELKKNKCEIDVWVDHDKSTTNLGDDVTFGMGDHKDSKSYHSDLTVAYGIRFFWLGRVTMITGQAAPINLHTFFDIFDSKHPIKSMINVSKEFSKHMLGIFGNRKYDMHKDNDLVRIKTLDDGQKVFEFIRFDNYWKGVSIGATNKGLSYVISKKTLDLLKENEGYSIVYTHLGKNSDCQQYICNETKEALNNLAKEYRLGNIYVTTTSKLLNYFIANKYLDWTHQIRNDECIIHINGIKDPLIGLVSPTANNMQGMTFYVPNREKARIFFREKELNDIQRNQRDHTGRESITIPLLPS